MHGNGAGNYDESDYALFSSRTGFTRKKEANNSPLRLLVCLFLLAIIFGQAM